MPLRIVYLLAGSRDQLAESGKMAPFHARSMIHAMCDDGHKVRVVCNEKGPLGNDEKPYKVIKAKRGRLAKRFTALFIRPCEKGEVPLQKRPLSFVLQTAVFLFCVGAGAALVGKNVSFHDGFTWNARAIMGIVLIAASFPLWKKMDAKAKKTAGEKRKGEPTEPSRFFLDFLGLLRQWDFYRRATRAVDRKGPPDVFYAQNARFAFSYHRLARKYDRPLVLEIHEMARDAETNGRKGIFQRLAENIERRNLKTAAEILALSDRIRRQAIEAGAAPEKVRLAPVGLEAEVFAKTLPDCRPLRAEGRRIVGTLCDFEPPHGLELLLEAAKLLKPRIPDLQFWIAGNGPEYEAVYEKIVHEDLLDFVYMSVETSEEEIPYCIASFDMAVVSKWSSDSSHDPPMGIHAYMAGKKPVICAQGAFQDALLVDGENILFHRDGDARDLAKKIEQLYRDPELAGKIGANGQTFVLPETWRERTRRVLESLAERGLLSKKSTVPKPEEPERPLSEEEANRFAEEEKQRLVWTEHETRRYRFLNLDGEEAASEKEARPIDLEESEEDRQHGRADLPRRPHWPVAQSRQNTKPVRGGRQKRQKYEIELERLAVEADRLEQQSPPRSVPRDRPLRVLRICASDFAGWAAKTMQQTVLRLDPDQVETTILATGQKDHVSPRLTSQPGVRVIRRPMALEPDLWDWAVFHNVDKIEEVLVDLKPDILHLHEPELGPLARVAAARHDVPMVMQLHYPYTSLRAETSLILQSIERKTMTKVSLMAPSENIVGDAYRYMRMGTSPENNPIERIPDGVDDLPLWARDEKLERWILQRAGKKKIFLSTGRFIALNRVPEYLTACRILMNLDEDLFMIFLPFAPDGKTQLIRRHFRAMFQPHEAELLHNVATPSDLLRHVHACLCCSSVEEPPVTLLEYMWNETPVICSDLPGHREFVEHEKTGLVHPPGDFPAMIQETHRILHDEDLRQDLVRNAKAALTGRSWEKTAEKTVEFYRRVLSS